MPNAPHTREAADFDGRRILVTGGTRGIGEAIDALAAAGEARIVAVSSSANADRLWEASLRLLA